MSKKKRKKDENKSTDEDNSEHTSNIHTIQPDEKNKILNSQCELLAEQLIKYKDESSKTAHLATKLKQELRKHDLKTTEMVAYLQNEIHQKDAQIEKLKNINYSLKSTTENHQQLTDMALFEMEQQHTSQFNQMESTQKSKISSLERAVESLKYVQKNKEEIENALLVAKSTMEAQAKKFKLSIDQLESKYIVDTQRIRDSTDKEILTLKNRARELAEQELDAQSRHLRIENKKMKQDLSFHCSTTSILHKDNEDKTHNIQLLNREIKLLKDTQREQAKQAVSYKHRIKQQTTKLNELENKFSTTTDEWDTIRKNMIKQFNCELESYKKQCKSSKAKNKMIQNELNSFKYYAKKLISQRTEIEQFFHEALDEVKKKAQKRLQNSYQQELNEYSDSLRKVGLDVNSIEDKRIANDEIGIKAPNKLEENKDPNSKLDIVMKLEDLTVEEKEHVLKVLISKINSDRNMQTSLMKNQINIKKLQNKMKPLKSMECDDQNDCNKTFITQKQIK
eukprot:550400_1